MISKIPLILVTGFLGSGKTSFLLNFLSAFSKSKRIAIIQNEFAQSSFDSEILKEEDNRFLLKELNKGSIFCACLFSSFKDTLADLAMNNNPDLVLIEATGIADPIAIAQVMDDERLNSSYYLQKIITIVDASRFLNVLENIIGVRHQIEVADLIFINKCDLADNEKIEQINRSIKEINPFASICFSNHGSFLQKNLLDSDVTSLFSNGIKGELTKCGKGHYVSRVLKTSQPISMESLNQFFNSLDADVLRVKGYVTDENGKSFIVQYVPGQKEIIPCSHSVGMTELLSIGFKEPNFNLLQCI